MLQAEGRPHSQRGQKTCGPILSVDAEAYERQWRQAVESRLVRHRGDGFQDVTVTKVGVDPAPSLGVAVPVDVGDVATPAVDRNGGVLDRQRAGEIGRGCEHNLS